MYNLPGKSSKLQSGQALLLMLLVMSLVLTLVLSSVSRSVTDVDISTYEDSSIRAFDAAQAGIEKTVVAPTPVVNQPIGTSYYTTNIGEMGGSNKNYKYPLNLASGDSAIITFVDHKLDNGDYVMTCGPGACQIPSNIRFCWGTPGTLPSSDTTPALYMEFYYNSDGVNPTKWMNMADLSSIKVATVSADPYSTRRGINNFSDLKSEAGNPQKCEPVDGYAFTSYYKQFDKNVLPPWVDKGMLLYAKITMLYNDIPQPLSLTSASTLPSQGWAISSTGQSGDSFRKLVLFQGFPELPAEFGNAMYSGNNLTK
jgi:hypothetical protein